MTSFNNNIFDEKYYEDGLKNNISCYENYRWMEFETINAIKSIIEFSKIEKGDFVLDYGCAKGFYVYAFIKCGINAYGYDISEYAVKNCKPEISSFITTDDAILYEKFDYILFKDVLEHLSKKELNKLLYKIKKVTKKIIVIVPLGDGKKYLYDNDNKDITHKIKEDYNWWRKNLCKNFKIINETYHLKNIKEKQYHYNKFSTGFFLCEVK